MLPRWRCLGLSGFGAFVRHSQFEGMHLGRFWVSHRNLELSSKPIWHRIVLYLTIGWVLLASSSTVQSWIDSESSWNEWSSEVNMRKIFAISSLVCFVSLDRSSSLEFRQISVSMIEVGGRGDSWLFRSTREVWTLHDGPVFIIEFIWIMRSQHWTIDCKEPSDIDKLDLALNLNWLLAIVVEAPVQHDNFRDCWCLTSDALVPEWDCSVPTELGKASCCCWTDDIWFRISVGRIKSLVLALSRLLAGRDWR